METSVVEYIIAAMMLVLGVIIALGKGDFLISGYNTASKEEKAKYNIKRLRLLVVVMLVIVSAGLLTGTLLEWNDAEQGYFAVAILLLAVVECILSYTWARKI